jgi:hypothetical protein
MPGFYTCAFGDFATDLDDVFVKKDFVAEGGLYAAGSRWCNITDPSCSATFSPVVVSGELRRWKQIAGGSATNNHGIDCMGVLWSWGMNNANGVIGNGVTLVYSTPVQNTLTSSRWKCVYTFGNCLFPGGGAAIRSDGTLWAWGINCFGRLGNNRTVNVSTPVQVLPCLAFSNQLCWKEVAMSNEHSLAIKTDGTLWAWGRNRAGQLGNSSTINVSCPVQVGTSQDWYKLPKIMGLAERSFAIKCDGTLWSWGHATADLQLGDGATTCRSSPVQVITNETFCEVSVGNLFGIAITRGGKLYMWGRNCHGLLGINCSDGTFVSTPVVPCCGESGWKTLAIHTNAGVSNTITGAGGVVALKKDGTAWAWGWDCCTGALGLGSFTTNCYITPVQILGPLGGRLAVWIDVRISSPYADGPTYMIRAETTTLTCDACQWYNNYYSSM